MKDERKTKKQLINELKDLRRRAEVLESVQAGETRAAEKSRGETRDLEELVSEQTAELKRADEAIEIGVAERDQALRLLQESVELLEGIFSNIHFLVAYMDEEFNFIRVNDAYAKAAGQTPEYFVGRNHFDLYPDAENEAIFRRTLETCQPYNAFERPFEYPDNPGETTYWDWSVHAVKTLEGEVNGLILTLVDVTDRKRAEERISLYASELERSNKDLEDFAYAASHDLQEPLRKIRTFGDRLESKYAEALGEEGRDYLERLLNASRRGQTLIDALLIYSRVSIKVGPLTRVDLVEATQEALSNLEIRIEETDARIEVGDMPAVEADPNQMIAMMQNLIGNALKFRRDEEPPRIKISADMIVASEQRRGQEFASSSHEKLCQIRVEDNGIGFDEKYSERIFNPFQRLHGRSAYEGVGMGLAICRKIAERHSGSISAKSTPGAGSIFTVTLPVKQSSDQWPVNSNQ
jgi:PAS domain S-box-containing protein